MFGFLTKKRQKNEINNLKEENENLKRMNEQQIKTLLQQPSSRLEEENKFLMELNDILTESYWNPEKEANYTQAMDIHPFINRLRVVDSALDKYELPE
jgi:hypothetical protein